MNFRLIWRGEAIRDVQEAYDWYASLSPTAGNELLLELDEYVAFILHQPLGPSIWRSKYRRVILKRFPFQLIYRIEESTRTIIIYSVFHTKRDPRSWGEKQ